MKKHHLSRRQFVVTGLAGTLANASDFSFKDEISVVSVVRINNDNVLAYDFIDGTTKL